MRQSTAIVLVGAAMLAGIGIPVQFAGAQMPQSAATPKTGGAEAPQPQASPTDIDGETLFATSCGFCHQSGGKTPGRGPKLAGSPRSDEYIIERIKKGKLGAMPAFGKAFSDGQIIAILAYIRSLDDGGG